MLNSLKNKEWCTAPVLYTNFEFCFHVTTVTFLKHCTHYTSQFKMWNYVVSSRKLTVVKWGIMLCLAV